LTNRPIGCDARGCGNEKGPANFAGPFVPVGRARV
jgi:hypothetical protein